MALRFLTAACVFVVGINCGPGPLPPVPSRADRIDYRKDWFPTDSDEPFPLDIAIRTNRIDEVRNLLERGADPNRRWGQSGDHFPLQEVLDSGGYQVTAPAETVQLLLNYGADPNAKWCPFESRGPSELGIPSCVSAKGMTALMMAAIVDRADIVRALLAAGADARPRNWHGGSALDYAYDEIAFELISRSLFPDLATRDRRALEWLIGDGDIVILGSRAPTPLARALAQSDGGYVVAPPPPNRRMGYRPEREDRVVNRLRTLVRIGADPNQRFDEERTPLSLALSGRALRAARVLLQNGADPNQRWCERVLPHWAVYSRTPTQLELRGKDPACSVANGITPLMWSAAVGDREAAELLLEFGADRSLKDWAGRSALHYATTREVWDVVTTEAPPPSR